MKHFFVFWLLAAIPAGAQSIGYGVRGGIPLNDTFDFLNRFSLQTVKTSRFTIGPTFEVRLPLGLSVQVDALYKRQNATFSTITGNTSTAHTWEIPLLAKYRLPGLVARPFVEGGVSFQSIGDVIKFATTQTADKSRRGFVLGAGLEAKLLKLRVSPEIRFTRWGETKFLPLTPTTLLNASSQAEFLVGLTF
jgi:opacity protein-like surface antigen